MQNEDARNFAVPSESRGNRHVQLRWIDVGEFMETERGLMTVNPLGLFAPVPGPERPDRKVRVRRLGKMGKPVNTAVLTQPVPCLNVIRMKAVRKPRSLRLLGRKNPGESPSPSFPCPPPNQGAARECVPKSSAISRSGGGVVPLAYNQSNQVAF